MEIKNMLFTLGMILIIISTLLTGFFDAIITYSIFVLGIIFAIIGGFLSKKRANIKNLDYFQDKRNIIKIFVLLIIVTLAFNWISSIDPISFYNWEQFTNEEGRFTVLLPGIPIEGSSKKSINEKNLSTNWFRVESGTKTNFGIVYYDLIENYDSDILLESLINTEIENLKNHFDLTVIHIKDISLQNYPGKEVLIKENANDVSIKTRIYYVKNRIYDISAASTQLIENENIDKFFDSFEIIE